MAKPTLTKPLPVVQGMHRHYKGGVYTAIATVEHHETRDPWVVYVLLDHGTVNIRPLLGRPDAPDGWDDCVTWPDGVSRRRFEKIDQHGEARHLPITKK